MHNDRVSAQPRDPGALQPVQDSAAVATFALPDSSVDSMQRTTVPVFFPTAYDAVLQSSHRGLPHWRTVGIPTM